MLQQAPHGQRHLGAVGERQIDATSTTCPTIGGGLVQGDEAAQGGDHRADVLGSSSPVPTPAAARGRPSGRRPHPGLGDGSVAAQPAAGPSSP